MRMFTSASRSILACGSKVFTISGMELSEFGKLLDELRRRRGLSKADLARIADISSRETVGRAMAARHVSQSIAPRREWLEKWAETFELLGNDREWFICLGLAKKSDQLVTDYLIKQKKERVSSLAEVLGKLIEQKTGSVTAFAKGAGCSQSFISRILSGDRQPPIKTVAKWCTVLQLDEEEKKCLMWHAQLARCPEIIQDWVRKDL